MKNQDLETIWLPEVDSTNRYALENFDWFPHGTLVHAAAQTAGRGSKGRSWASPPDVNVYASIVLKGFPFSSAQAAWIGSLAALELLRGLAPRETFAVKWPNDVKCNGRKIAGMLCETKNDGIVIGAGINVNMTQDQLGPLLDGATSLFLETGCLTKDVGTLAFSLRDLALDFYGQARRNGVDSLHTLWSRENELADKEITLLLADNRILSGLVVDFSGDGALIVVENGTGQIHSVASADILHFRAPKHKPPPIVPD